MSASVVADGDAPPLLEFQVLDRVALMVKGLIVGEWDFAAPAGRDAWLYPSGFEFFAEPPVVVSARSEIR